MEKTYNPHDIETKWYKNWEERNYFSPKDADDGYCIMIPPPNVTGSLHMGHGFQNAIMDALIRYQRMSGKSTLWQMGVDHAGIATQMVVERQLLADNQTRHDLGREKFIDKIWQWKEKSGDRIGQQLRRLGSSVDWTNERFTMDEELSKAVREVFICLYNEGLIYRGQRLVNWDPKLHTAISDLEVISEETKGNLWHLRYPLEDGSGDLIVATTRPETLLGDTAVAVNPKDERYQHLIGKYVKLPLCDRTIPIIADDYVDQEFGSGCVKITPAHDFNDYQIGKRHDLPLINILTIDAKINEHAPEAYQGLDRFDARKKIIADLQVLNLLEKIEDHNLVIPKGDRSGVVLEPYLTDQWFVKAQILAEPAIAAVERGDIEFIPNNWVNTYNQWMNNIEDWCISRQLWWGHRIPAWYDESGNVYVGENEAEIRQKHQLADNIQLKQDEDVLDTWFSSALWPFTTLGWPEKTEKLETFYPTSVLVTGFDIIFFWVARMIMMGLKFTGKVPFKQVYITGLIRDGEGQKMSKSKGNVLDPLDLIDGIDLESLIEKRTQGLMQPEMAKKISQQTRKEFPEGIPSYGTDALRFTFCALASTGRDIRFDLGRLAGYRNFCNKLWNATRFVLMNVENQDNGLNKIPTQFSLADRWIQTKLQQTLAEVKRHFENYRFDLATTALYEFTWNEYCDWYLELSKPILNNADNTTAQLATRYTLLQVLESLLRALHPFMPFITEEIWQQIAPLAGKQGETIMLQPYPESIETLVDNKAVEELEWVKQCITGIRSIRAEMNIAPGKPLSILTQKGTARDQQYLNKQQLLLKALAKIETITPLTDDTNPPPAATTVVGDLELLIPLADLIDKDAEIARLNKEIEKLNKELNKIDAKLSNPNFVDKAPAVVVEKQKVQQQELKQMLTKLEDQQEKITGL